MIIEPERSGFCSLVKITRTFLGKVLRMRDTDFMLLGIINTRFIVIILLMLLQQQPSLYLSEIILYFLVHSTL